MQMEFIEIAHEGKFSNGRGGTYKITRSFLDELLESFNAKMYLAWDIGHALATSENVSLSLDDAILANLVHGISTFAKVEQNEEGKYAFYVNVPRFSQEAKKFLETTKPYPSIAFFKNDETVKIHSVSLVSNPNIDLPKISEQVLIINSSNLFKPVKNMTQEEKNLDAFENKALAILLKIYNKQLDDVIDNIDEFLLYARENAEIIAQYVKDLETEADKLSQKDKNEDEDEDEDENKNNDKNNDDESLDKNNKNNFLFQKNSLQKNEFILNSIIHSAEEFVTNSSFEKSIEFFEPKLKKELKERAKQSYIATLVESGGITNANNVAKAAANAMSIVINAATMNTIEAKSVNVIDPLRDIRKQLGI
jgi:hypothetical protein